MLNVRSEENFLRFHEMKVAYLLSSYLNAIGVSVAVH